MPYNHKNNSELLDIDSFKVNSSLSVADKRAFPLTTNDLLPSSSNLVSPFDVSTFGKQLLPLINVNIKEKVKDFARTFNTGADLIEDAIRESWRESPLNPHNFKDLIESPNLFKHLPFPPSLPAVNSLRKPVHLTKAQQKHKEKAPKAIESYSVDSMMHDYGINGYKHFEESILRELEKQEERKVEATIHTLFEHGDRIELIKGKPYDYKSGWQPVAAPTKNYEDNSNINSQIISPLHTSIFNSPQLSSAAPHGFHDFDNLNGNTIHSTYSVHEEEGESKIKPVKAKIPSFRKFTPSPPSAVFTRSTSTEKSRYRKRHNNNVVKTVGQVSVAELDSGASGSHDAPKHVNKAKRNPQRYHIQSLTTSKPRNQVTSSGNITTEESPKLDISTETFGKMSLSYGSEVPSRLRSTTSTTTTKTTIKPSRNFAREAPKFVDKTKATGYRGSVKFGQTTTQKPI